MSFDTQVEGLASTLPHPGGYDMTSAGTTRGLFYFLEIYLPMNDSSDTHSFFHTVEFQATLKSVIITIYKGSGRQVTLF